MASALSIPPVLSTAASQFFAMASSLALLKARIVSFVVIP